MVSKLLGNNYIEADRMKIKRDMVERCTIEEFADRHGLVMEVHERNPIQFPFLPRFFAYFSHAEIAERGCLVGTFGNGQTELDAIDDYARAISGKILAIDAYSKDRRNIDVPILT